MSLWDVGEKHQKYLRVEPWRVVEAQHISSSRDLVDTREEHDLLEELLESSKPKIFQDKHYLLFTPFRYPPLKYGSRFGRIHESSLWYGSLEQDTAFAEAGYYRLQFFNDCEADLGFIEIPMTAFQCFLATQRGIDLTQPPFDVDVGKITSQTSYEYSQPLGTEMRIAGVEAFTFFSARAKKRSQNIAAFTPDVFVKRNNQFVHHQQNWMCIAKKDVIEFTRFEILKKERLLFSIEDYALE